MHLSLFSRFFYSCELPSSWYVATNEIAGKKNVVDNLSSYFCILTTSLQLLLLKEDHVFRLTREVGGSVLCESTKKKKKRKCVV